MTIDLKEFISSTQNKDTTNKKDADMKDVNAHIDKKLKELFNVNKEKQ